MRRHAGDAAAIAVYTGLAFFTYIHLWAAPGPASVGSNNSDAALTMWFMSYVPFALRHGHSLFLSNYLNAPVGVNLMDNTAVTADGLLFAPITVLLGPATAYVSAMTFALASSATAMYVLLRRWTAGRRAAFLGGLLYGFGPYMVGQGSGHLHLTEVALPPLVVLVLYEVVVGRRWSPTALGCAMSALVVAQFFTSTEVLADTAMMCAVGLVVAAVAHRHAVAEVRARFVRFAATTVGICVVVLAYPLWVMELGPQHFALTPTSPVVFQKYRADLLGLVVPSRLEAVAPSSALKVSSHFLGGGVGENGDYLGVPLLLVMTVALVVLWKRSALAKVFGITLVVSVVLEMGARLVVSGSPADHLGRGLPMPEGVISHLPLVGAVAPIRFSLYAVFSASVILALLLDRSFAAAGRRHRRSRDRWVTQAAAVTTALVVLVPLIPRLPYPAGRIDQPRYFLSGAVDRIPDGSTAVVYPFPLVYIDSTAPMLWQSDAAMRFKMVAGFALLPSKPSAGVGSTTEGAFGDLYSRGGSAESPDRRRAILDEWRSWKVTTVLVGVDSPGGEPAVSYLTWLLGSPPEIAGGVAAWYRLPAPP